MTSLLRTWTLVSLCHDRHCGWSVLADTSPLQCQLLWLNLISKPHNIVFWATNNVLSQRLVWKNWISCFWGRVTFWRVEPSWRLTTALQTLFHVPQTLRGSSEWKFPLISSWSQRCHSEGQFPQLKLLITEGETTQLTTSLDSMFVSTVPIAMRRSMKNGVHESVDGNCPH